MLMMIFHWHFHWAQIGNILSLWPRRRKKNHWDVYSHPASEDKIYSQFATVNEKALMLSQTNTHTHEHISTYARFPSTQPTTVVLYTHIYMKHVDTFPMYLHLCICVYTIFARSLSIAKWAWASCSHSFHFQFYRVRRAWCMQRRTQILRSILCPWQSNAIYI